MSRTIICLTLCAIVLFQNAASWPSGAPDKTCTNLLPRHGGTPSKEAGDSPYRIQQSASTYQPGDQIKVLVSSSRGTLFKGLLVQAVDPETGKTVGSFIGGTGLKTIDKCSAVTHSDNKNKRSATLVWQAPEDGTKGGSVIFRGTVVERYDSFYRGLLSALNEEI